MDGQTAEEYAQKLEENLQRLLERAKSGMYRAPPVPFDLLGFTHHWGLSHKGKWIVKRRTAKDRFSRWLHRHDPVGLQQRDLGRKLRGHYSYFGITSNIDGVRRFFQEVKTIWREWLSRRSSSGRLSWERMHALLKRFPLPAPRIVHRYGT